MQNMFDRGSFSGYKNSSRMDSARSEIKKSIYESASQKQTTVFISHKHDDLDELAGLLGFLEQNYGVKVYIDSRDPLMPQVTSGQTAANIKSRINQCDKFILLATNGAIESKWCNWELGYGDAQKYQNNSIALFPVKSIWETDNDYKGNEYMQIYPHIAYCDGTGGDHYISSGKPIPVGFYVLTENADGTYIPTSLADWLKR